MSSLMEAEARRWVPNRSGLFVPRATSLESLAVAQVEPDGAELARAGCVFGGGLQVVGSGIANDATIPTTTAKLALFNGEADGGKSLVLLGVHWGLTAGTPAIGSTLMVALSGAKLAAAVAMAANFSLASLSGGGQATKATLATGVTLTGSPAWLGLASNLQGATADVGQGNGAMVKVRGIVIPPGYALGFAVLTGAGTAPKYGVWVTFAQLALDLE